MSIRRHGHRWQVRLRIGAGQRIERTLPSGATRADARALEAALRRAAIDAAAGRDPARLLDDAIDRWVESGAAQLKSYRTELRFRIEVLREYTAAQPLAAVVDVAERLKRDGLREGLKPASINRYLAILRRVANLAERWGWTDQPLGRRIQLLPEHNERHLYLTPQQVQALCDATDARTADMIRFAVLTGLRLGEMLALRPEQVRDGLLVLEADTKSGRPRVVPLPPEAARIAAARLPWPRGRKELRARWVAAREAVGLPQARWHDLRHTYASWLVQAGQPLTAVRDLLGHASLAVTHRYAHLAPAHLVQAVAALPDLTAAAAAGGGASAPGGDRVGTRPRRTRAKKAA